MMLDDDALQAELEIHRRQRSPDDRQKGVVLNELFYTLRAGDRIGRFVVIAKIGQGGMGTVHRAYDEELDRHVAIKVLRCRTEREAQRLQREARALARLGHPNVVSVYEVGRHGGNPFIVMELVEGSPLGAWQRAKPRHWSELVRAYRQAAEGLAAAHAKGLVHRDFKPSNCIIDASGRVRVVDFGLARLGHDDEPATEPKCTGLGPGSGGSSRSSAGSASRTPADRLTMTGATVGTRGYIAPEQWRAPSTDPRSDQFSFCVSLYKALYGLDNESPFRERSYDLAAPPSGRRVPRWLRHITIRGLSESPDERWPSMKALIEALDDGQRRTMVRRTTRSRGMLLFLVLLCVVPAFPPAPQAQTLEPMRTSLLDAQDRIRTLDRSGKHQEGLIVLERLMPLVERVNDPRIWIEALQLEGQLHVSAGDDARAQECFDQALDLASSHGLEGVALEGTAGMIHLLGVEHQHTDAALELGAKAETLAHGAGVDPVRLAKVITATAQVLTVRGELEEAIGRYSEAIELIESTQGAGHIELAEVLDGQGVAWMSLGDLDRAEAAQRRALGVRETWQGPDHPAVAYQRTNLAAVLYAKGERAEAAAMIERALEVLVHVEQPDHKRIAHAYMDLGTILSKLGRPADAEMQHRKALEHWHLAGQPDHMRTATTHFNLARALEKQGRDAEALEQCNLLLQILDRNEPSNEEAKLRAKADACIERLRASPVPVLAPAP